jgi:hypothetical protein
MLNDWINGIQAVPYERIREMLYNIEQFRADALSMMDPAKNTAM